MTYALYEKEKGTPRYVGETTSNLRKKLGVLKYSAKQENNWNSPLVRWINANEIEILLLEDDGQKEWWVEYLKYLGCNLLNNTTGCEDGNGDKKCEICGAGFTKNQVQGGVFTSHIKTKHGMSKQEYVIETKYDGEPPKCECGLCDETPRFHRGEFKTWASRKHMSHEWRKQKYIEKFGYPKCGYEECENKVEFRRGEPHKYCSNTCSGKDNGGFAQPEIQEKIKRVCKEKYGVKNPSELEEVKKKTGAKNLGNNPWAAMSESTRKETKQKISEWSKKMWEENKDEMKKKISKAHSDISEKKSRIAKKLRQNEEYVKNLTSSIAETLGSKEKSKPHKKFCDKLNLKEKGYKSEQQVGSYIVDELNEENNKIIEVFGDYVHANPEKFDPEDVIKLPGNTYKAKEKWEHDRKKIDWLEKQGYEVVILWSSDEISEAREKL